MNLITLAQMSAVSAGLGAITFREELNIQNNYNTVLEYIGSIIEATSDAELLEMINVCLDTPIEESIDFISDIFKEHYLFFEATSKEIIRARKDGKGIIDVQKDFSDHNKKALKQMTPSFIRNAVAKVKRSGVAKAIRKGMNNSMMVQQAKKAWHGSASKSEYGLAKKKFSQLGKYVDGAKKHSGKGTGIKGEYNWSRYLQKAEDGQKARLRGQDHKKKYDLAKNRIERIKKQTPPHTGPVPVRTRVHA